MSVYSLNDQTPSLLRNADAMVPMAPESFDRMVPPMAESFARMDESLARTLMQKGVAWSSFQIAIVSLQVLGVIMIAFGWCWRGRAVGGSVNGNGLLAAVDSSVNGLGEVEMEDNARVLNIENQS
jgi:hypothetical protein